MNLPPRSVSLPSLWELWPWQVPTRGFRLDVCEHLHQFGCAWVLFDAWHARCAPKCRRRESAQRRWERYKRALREGGVPHECGTPKQSSVNVVQVRLQPDARAWLARAEAQAEFLRLRAEGVIDLHQLAASEPALDADALDASTILGDVAAWVAALQRPQDPPQRVHELRAPPRRSGAQLPLFAGLRQAAELQLLHARLEYLEGGTA